nr:hypothetical protein [Sedimentibacter sp.]
MFKVTRIIAFILIVVLCFSLIACNKNTSKAESSIPGNVAPNENETSLYQIFVPISDASEELKINEIILPEQLNGMEASCTGIYDESNILVVLYTKLPTIIHEIGMYNFETNDYKKLMNIGEDECFEISTFNEDYMILRLSEDDWKTCQLYYFSFADMELVSFFSYTVDPSKNRVYAQNNNSIVVIDDKVYFDDFFSDSKGQLRVNLYEYIIGKQQLIPLFEDAQNPMVYNGDIASFRKNSEGKFKDIVSSDNNLILSNTKHLKQITVNKNGFFCIENNATNDKTKITTFQITDMFKNKPILSTEYSIDNLHSNNRFVTWTNYYEEKPYIYDTEKEQLILFSNIPTGVNSFLFSDELGILINTKDDKSRLFVFALQ